MATRPKAVIESRNGEKFSPITITKNVLTDDGQNLHDILSDRKEDMMTPTIENSSSMFKVGQGDNVDYSSNVVNGAYESMVLKGKTMVNCIQEPSESSYVALGENLEFQNKKVEYTTNGQIKSAMLKGQTLVNLVERVSVEAGSYSKENEYFTVEHKTDTNYISFKLKCRYKLHTDKNYMLFINVKENTLTSVVRTTTPSLLQDKTLFDGGFVGVYKLKFSASDSNSDFIWLRTNSGSSGKLVFSCMVLEYQEGMENWDIPYFEGIQSVTMTTELENVCSRYNSSGAKNGKTFTVDNVNARRIILSNSSNITNYGFKQNTKYLMQFKITNLNLDGEEYIKLIFSDSNVSSGNALFGDYASTTVKITKNGIYRTVLTTSTVIDTSVFIIKGLAEQWENTSSTSRTLTISQIMCIEYQNGMENWDLPYFEATQLMKPIKVQSTNKNLFNINDIPSSISGAKVNVTNSNGTITVTSKSNEGACYTTLTNYANIKLKKGVNYRLSCNFTTSNSDANATLVDITNNNALNCPVNDSNSTVIRRTYCPTEDVTVCLRFYAATGSNGKNGGVTTYTNIQLEESSTATDYAPHQSKTISALEPITLRAIGNIKDTLDLSTGEYVQRIGEINSNEMTITSISNGNNMVGGTDYCNALTVRLPNAKNANSYELIEQELCIKSDKKNCLDRGDINWHLPSSVGKIVKHSSTNYKEDLWVIVPTDIATNELAINYLKDNPFTVQYVLDTPITRKISLEYPNLQTYQDITHVQSIAMDGTLIPKIFLPSDISYKAMLKPNTSYNVVIDREVIDSTNQLTVNLGGATATTTVGNRVTTITTPSTLSNELLTMSGRGNKLNHVMVIEGDVVGDEPYFEGICDCKSPILSNIGKNLFDRVGCSPNFTYCASWWWEDNVLKIESNGQTYNSVGFDFYLKKGTYSISVNEPTYIKVSIIDSHTIFETTTTGRAFTVSNDSKIRITFFANLNTTGVVEKAISNIQLEESTTPTTYEPYKSNILSCNGDKVELTEDMFEQGNVGGNDKVGSTYEETKKTSNSRIRLISLLSVKPNTTYHMSCDSNYKMGVRLFDVNGLFTGEYHEWYDDFAFTTNSNTKYVTIKMKKNDNATITPTIISEAQPELREVDKTIVLRSLPNGVCDTLNVETGEYVQRIGEIVFDGEFNLWAQNCEDVQYYRVGTGTINNFKLNSCIINDKLPVAKKVTAETKGEFVGDHTNSQSIHIRLLSSKLSQRSVNGVQEYLRANPITVQYELETPITTKVDVQGFPHAYKNGHVVLSSGSIEQSLTPKVEYSVVTNRNGQIRSNQKMVERHQKQLDRLQAMILTNLVNTQYEQALTNLKYDLKNVREEVK